jgi:hypothetical protein
MENHEGIKPMADTWELIYVGIIGTSPSVGNVNFISTEGVPYATGINLKYAPSFLALLTFAKAMNKKVQVFFSNNDRNQVSYIYVDN